MKNYQPVIFLMAIIVATVLFAFKSEEPTKQYATIQFHETNKKDAIIVNVNGESKSISTETLYDEKKFLETLNGLASEGWKITSTDYASTGSYANRVVYLERIKQ